MYLDRCHTWVRHIHIWEVGRSLEGPGLFLLGCCPFNNAPAWFAQYISRPIPKTGTETARFTQHIPSPCAKEAPKQRGLHSTLRAPRPKEAPKQRGLRNNFRAPCPKQAPEQRGLRNTFRAPCGMPKTCTGTARFAQCILSPMPKTGTGTSRFAHPICGHLKCHAQNRHRSSAGYTIQWYAYHGDSFMISNHDCEVATAPTAVI